MIRPGLPTLLLLPFLLPVLLLGCATVPEPAPAVRPFDVHRDTFAWENELEWIYDFTAEGKVKHSKRENVENGQRCMAMARVARQFYYGAAFHPMLPKVSEAAYGEIVDRVLDTDPRADGPLPVKVIVPGYADLRSFSVDHEATLKERLGGRWRSYLQRGNWRMIFPFAPRQQRATAESVFADVARGRTPILRVVTFPQVNVNHAIVVYEAEASPTQIRFRAYDPNNSESPVALLFERATATFRYDATEYYQGGVVNAYEIYTGFFF